MLFVCEFGKMEVDYAQNTILERFEVNERIKIKTNYPKIRSNDER